MSCKKRRCTVIVCCSRSNTRSSASTGRSSTPGTNRRTVSERDWAIVLSVVVGIGHILSVVHVIDEVNIPTACVHVSAPRRLRGKGRVNAWMTTLGLLMDEHLDETVERRPVMVVRESEACLSRTHPADLVDLPIGPEPSSYHR